MCTGSPKGHKAPPRPAPRADRLRADFESHPDAIGRDSIHRAILESLHRPLDGPAGRAVCQAHGDVNLSLRVVVIRHPLAATFSPNDLANVRADCEQPGAQILGK
jgi:hypothetical protein